MQLVNFLAFLFLSLFPRFLDSMLVRRRAAYLVLGLLVSPPSFLCAFCISFSLHLALRPRNQDMVKSHDWKCGSQSVCALRFLLQPVSVVKFGCR